MENTTIHDVQIVADLDLKNGTLCSYGLKRMVVGRLSRFLWGLRSRISLVD